MSETPTTEPNIVTAGDTISWQISLPDYPASAGWVLSYAMIGPAGVITISSSASADDHLVSVSATNSAAWAAGNYTWNSYATKSAERYTVSSGRLTVQPNLATATAAQGKSSFRKQLEAVQAVLEGRATFSQRSLQIGDKRIDRHSVIELMQVQNDLLNKVAYEESAARLAAGLPNRNNVLVRFI